MNNNIDHPKTIEDLDKIIEQKQVQKPAVWPYIIGSFIIPPFTLVAMLIITWRKGLLYLFLPTVTIFSSALTILLLFTSLLPLLNLASAFGNEYSIVNTQTIVVIIAAIVLVVVGFISGIILRNKAKKISGLNIIEKSFLFVILILQYVVSYFVTRSIVSIIYDFTATF